MNTSSRILVISALALLSSFGAHADEADGSDRALSSLPFSSTRSVADVRAEAAMPNKISNGGTGVIGVTNSGVSRAEVRAQAAAAVRNGAIPQGEIGLM